MNFLVIALILIAIIIVLLLVSFEKPTRSVKEIVIKENKLTRKRKTQPANEFTIEIEEDVEFLIEHAKAVIEESEGIKVLDDNN